MTIRIRLFLWIFLLFGVGFYFFVDIVTDDIQPRYREATEEPIVDTAHVLAAFAAATAHGSAKKRLPTRTSSTP